MPISGYRTCTISLPSYLAITERMQAVKPQDKHITRAKVIETAVRDWLTQHPLQPLPHTLTSGPSDINAVHIAGP
jgi:hypothetical protein